MRITVDVGDLDALVADYAAIPDKAEPAALQALTRGAMNIKRDARRLFQSQTTGKYLPHYPNRIDFDEEVGDGWAEAEIGPQGRPQGEMGRGVEYGSARGKPIPHLIPAFEAEAPRFGAQVAQALDKALP